MPVRVRVAAIFGTEERHETAMLGTEQSGAAIFGTEERHQAAILGGNRRDRGGTYKGHARAHMHRHIRDKHRLQQGIVGTYRDIYGHIRDI